MLIVASTLYLRYHYFTDLLVGATLAVICFHAASWVMMLWPRQITRGISDEPSSVS